MFGFCKPVTLPVFALYLSLKEFFLCERPAELDGLLHCFVHTVSGLPSLSVNVPDAIKIQSMMTHQDDTKMPIIEQVSRS